MKTWKKNRGKKKRAHENFPSKNIHNDTKATTPKRGFRVLADAKRKPKSHTASLFITTYIHVSHFKRNETTHMRNPSNFVASLSRCGRSRKRFPTSHCEPSRTIRHFRAGRTLWDLHRMMMIIIMMERWWTWWWGSMYCGKIMKKRLGLKMSSPLSIVATRWILLF